MSGKLKLNFDGRARGDPSLSGIGGFIRDTSTTSILAFSGLLGFCLVNEAEMLTL